MRAFQSLNLRAGASLDGRSGADTAHRAPAVLRGSPLRIGAAHDAHEREADRMAEAALRGDAIVTQTSRPDDATVRRACSKCQDEEELKRSAEPGLAEGGLTPAGVGERIKARRGGGTPLTPSARAFFEPRFAHDFSRVRVHADSEAGDLAVAVQAHAFTFGNDIYFGQGRHAPGRDGFQRLLAHELAHVAQQGQGEAARIHRQAAPAIRPAPRPPARPPCA
jgi:hypothetical protein